MILCRVQRWEEIKSIVEECFSGDIDLVEKYHIKSGTSLNECVEDTFMVLKNFTNPDFMFYKIIDTEVCGFIGIEPEGGHLTTFCLKNGYRSSENKERLWDLIVESFNGGNFNCGLYSKNERAINYLLSKGCKIGMRSIYNENPIVILNYIKKEVICH